LWLKQLNARTIGQLCLTSKDNTARQKTGIKTKQKNTKPLQNKKWFNAIEYASLHTVYGQVAFEGIF
jgi:hypothetical protein